MAIKYVCDECGKDATTFISLATGYVHICGKPNGQDCHLCDDHKPTKENSSQPNNCEDVIFRWPEAVYKYTEGPKED